MDRRSIDDELLDKCRQRIFRSFVGMGSCSHNLLGEVRMISCILSFSPSLRPRQFMLVFSISPVLGFYVEVSYDIINFLLEKNYFKFIGKSNCILCLLDKSYVLF